MASIKVDLPDSLLEWIDAEVVGQAESASVGDYIANLISEDFKQRNGGYTLDQLRGIVEDAEASGISPRSPRDIFEDVLQRIRRGA